MGKGKQLKCASSLVGGTKTGSLDSAKMPSTELVAGVTEVMRFGFRISLLFHRCSKLTQIRYSAPTYNSSNVQHCLKIQFYHSNNETTI